MPLQLLGEAIVSDDILVRVDAQGIAVVTLNRPAKRNAMSLAMWRELGVIFTDLARRPDVRVAILTGAGGHFCAGADISEFAAVRSTAADADVYDRDSGASYTAIRAMSKPTIAAVEGFAMGGGCGLALCCDFRVARTGAKFGIPAARLGIVYSLGECQALFNTVGLANAKRILFSGAPVELDESVGMGFVDATTDGPVEEAAIAFAQRMTENAPLAISGMKTILNALADGTAHQREAEFAALASRSIESEDYKEGGRAFMEKRRPKFQGR
jgi:enoyl-CoA hydratase/carnithine racemase